MQDQFESIEIDEKEERFQERQMIDRAKNDPPKENPFGIKLIPPYPMTTPMGYEVKYPFPSAWEGQLETIDRCMQTMSGAGSYILLNAGTGFGKSPVLMGLSSIFDTAWLLVGKRDLVEQWRMDYEHFNHVGFLKSRQSFQCNVLPNKDCSEGHKSCSDRRLDMQKRATNRSRMPEWAKDAKTPRDWLDKHQCPYQINRDFALERTHTVMTVSMALTIFTHLKGVHPGVFKRNLLVVDECSELEDELLRFYTLGLSTRQMVSVTDSSSFCDDMERPDGTLESSIKWIEKAYENINRFIGSLPLPSDRTKEQDKQASECSDLLKKIKHIQHTHEQGIPLCTEVSEMKFFRNRKQYLVEIKPLEARGLFDKTLGQMADHCVFTSATTGPANLFRSTHAMQRQVDYVEVESVFPAKNRPIFFVPLGKLSRAHFKSNIEKVINGIVKIAKNTSENNTFDHSNQKGVIHTHTRKIMDLTIKAMEKAGLGDRLVPLVGSGSGRLENFEEFKRSKDPLILITPSGMLGLSLKDELARWQVIVKMPYANLGDPSVVYRKDMIDGWYGWQTSKFLIQAFGRIIRSSEDWGITYVLDTCFKAHWSWNKDHFPHYVREAIRIIDR